MADMIYNLLYGHNLEASRLLEKGPDIARPRETSSLLVIFDQAYDSICSISRELLEASTQSPDIASPIERGIKEERAILEELHSQMCCPQRNGNYVPGSYGFKGGWTSYFPRINSKRGIGKNRVFRQLKTPVAFRTYRRRHVNFFRKKR